MAEIKTRLNKLDSFFLWVASLSGVGFSIFVSYLRIAWAPYVPVFLLIGFALYIGYLRGAVFSDSFTERIRGWNYLLIGLITYVLYMLFSYLINPFVEANLTGYSLVIQTIVIVTLLFSFIFLNARKTTPWLYNNFDQPHCKITKIILRRTILASVILGTLLYVFALILSTSSQDGPLIVYLFTSLFLIAPIYNEEKKIGKLLALEKYYKYIEVEPIERRKRETKFLVIAVISEVSMVVVQWLSIGLITLILLLILVIVFFTCFFGYVISLYRQDRGDMVKESEIARVELAPQELSELRQLIIKANS